MDNVNNNFNQNIEKLKSFLKENNHQKNKTVANEVDSLIAAIEQSYKHSLEKDITIKNEEFLKKVKEVENKAALKIAEKIDELDKKKKEELENAKRFAIEKSIISAINVLDQLEIALGYAALDPTIKNYVAGFRMVADSFLKWLNEMNIEKMPIEIGDPFDDQTMSAFEKLESNLPKNHVVKITKACYTLHDKIIRHAVVAVSDGSLATKNVLQEVKTVAIEPTVAKTQQIHPTTQIKNIIPLKQHPTIQSIPPRINHTQQILHHVDESKPKHATQVVPPQQTTKKV